MNFYFEQKNLNNLQEKSKDTTGSFCGYGVAVRDFRNLNIDWNKNNTLYSK